MNRLYITSLIIIILAFINACDSTIDALEDKNPCDGVTRLFVEENGILNIELENAEVPEGWEKRTNLPDYLGKSYLQWEGDNHMRKPGDGIVTYKIEINNTGIYRIQIRGYIAEGTSGSEHNDVWLRMPDANDYYGEKNGNVIYPAGIGKSPNPKGASSDGWFKIYNNTKNKWSWASRTSDHDGHNIYAKFNKADVYTIEISGRSSGFAVDRITLYQENGDLEGDDDTLPASIINCQ